MIFVVTGTQKFQFNRLLKILDELVRVNAIKEKIFAQIGNSTYYPTNYSYIPFLSKSEFNKYMNKCDLLITHSGVATIMAGLKLNKPVIVMPRMKKYGEHVDDHQMQIAESFSNKNFILICKEDNDLIELIKEAKVHIFNKYISQQSQIINTIEKFIDNMK